MIGCRNWNGAKLVTDAAAEIALMAIRASVLKVRTLIDIAIRCVQFPDFFFIGG